MNQLNPVRRPALPTTWDPGFGVLSEESPDQLDYCRPRPTFVPPEGTKKTDESLILQQAVKNPPWLSRAVACTVHKELKKNAPDEHLGLARARARQDLKNPIVIFDPFNATIGRFETFTTRIDQYLIEQIEEGRLINAIAFATLYVRDPHP